MVKRLFRVHIILAASFQVSGRQTVARSSTILAPFIIYLSPRRPGGGSRVEAEKRGFRLLALRGYPHPAGYSKHPLSQARPIGVQEGRRSGGGEPKGAQLLWVPAFYRIPFGRTSCATLRDRFSKNVVFARSPARPPVFLTDSNLFSKPDQSGFRRGEGPGEGNLKGRSS